MSIIPILKPKQMLAILLKAGFKIVGQKGSHIRLKHPFTNKATTVALHNTDFSRKMISQILKQAGLTISEFLKLLK